MHGSKALEDLLKLMIRDTIIGQTRLEAIAAKIGQSATVLLDSFAKNFEKHVKRTFDVHSEGDVSIYCDFKLPNEPDIPQLKSKAISLKKEQMCAVYEHYCKNLKSLIDEQVEGTIKKLCEDNTIEMFIEIKCVGRGALPPYVMSRIVQEYGQYTVTNEEVSQ
jgi:hypothetical protein